MADRTFDESCYTTGQQRVAQRFLFLRSNIDIGGRHIVIVAWGNYGTDFAIKGGNNLWYVVQPYLFQKEKKSWYVEWSYYDVWWRIDWMTESRSYHATCCHSRASHPVEHTLSIVFQPLLFLESFVSDLMQLSSFLIQYVNKNCASLMGGVNRRIWP